MSVSERKQSLYKIVAALTTIAVLQASPAPATPSAAASRYASVVMDAETGAILYERNADLPRHPASLTKIMTLYLAFEALATKKLTLNDELPVSAYAAGRDPSRLDLAPGSRLRVADAIRGITTKSANDAACIIGEALGGGSEKRFAERMTAKAKALGLTQTTFLNASGLPEEGHMTSARDLALLCKALVQKYPEYYQYFATDTFQFHGTRFHNQNRFLHTYYGADGIKTGFVNASGHNLAASAVRGGKRLIAIVLGGDTQAWTREHATRLLDVSYAKIDPSLVMVASNQTNSAAGEGEESTAAPAAEVVTTTAATGAAPEVVSVVAVPAAVAAAPAPIPLPNATANLAAFVAAATAPKLPAGSVAAVVAGANAVTTLPQASATATTVAPANPSQPKQPATAATANAATAAERPQVPAGTHAVVTPASEQTRPAAQPQNAAVSAPVAAHLPAAAPLSTPPAAVSPSRTDTSSNAVVATPASVEKPRAAQSDRPASVAPGTATATPVAAPPKSTPKTPQPAEAVAVPAGSPAAAADTTAPAAETISSSTTPAGGEWSVQVGLFRDATVARRRGEEARRQMPLQLRGADLVVGRALDGVHVTSRLSRLSEQDARTACNELQRGRVPCVVVPPGRPLIVATN